MAVQPGLCRRSGVVETRLIVGGAGGAGHYRGGDGSASSNCTTGGTAGEDESSTTLEIPGISHNLFCGAGGYSDDCEGSRVSSETRQFAGPGGTDGNRSIGLYSFIFKHADIEPANARL